MPEDPKARDDGRSWPPPPTIATRHLGDGCSYMAIAGGCQADDRHRPLYFSVLLYAARFVFKGPLLGLFEGVLLETFRLILA